jgi:hypothetical protein
VWTYSHYTIPEIKLCIAEGDVREFQGDALLCGDYRRLNLGFRCVRTVVSQIGVTGRIEVCEDPLSRWRVILSQRLNPKAANPYLGPGKRGNQYVDGLQTKVYLQFMLLVREGFKRLERTVIVPMGWRQPELTALSILGAVTGFVHPVLAEYLITDTKEFLIVSLAGASMYRDLVESGRLSTYLKRNGVFNYPERIWVNQLPHEEGRQSARLATTVNPES